MRILIDIDSTINNFSEVLLDELNKRDNARYDYKDILYWEWFDDKFNNPWLPLRDKEFWAKVKVSQNAVNAITKLKMTGHEVFLVSASAFVDTLGFKIIQTIGAFPVGIITEKNIVIAQNKSIIMGDVMIDDNVDNLIASPCRTKIMYKQPWNKLIKDFYTTDNWQTITELITVLSKM